MGLEPMTTSLTGYRFFVAEIIFFYLSFTLKCFLSYFLVNNQITILKFCSYCCYTNFERTSISFFILLISVSVKGTLTSVVFFCVFTPLFSCFSSITNTLDCLERFAAVAILFNLKLVQEAGFEPTARLCSLLK